MTKLSKVYDKLTGDVGFLRAPAKFDVLPFVPAFFKDGLSYFGHPFDYDKKLPLSSSLSLSCDSSSKPLGVGSDGESFPDAYSSPELSCINVSLLVLLLFSALSIFCSVVFSRLS